MTEGAAFLEGPDGERMALQNPDPRTVDRLLQQGYELLTAAEWSEKADSRENGDGGEQ